MGLGWFSPESKKTKYILSEDLDSIVDPLDLNKPESVLFHFFLFMLKEDFSSAWNLLSQYSQQKILEDVYAEFVNSPLFYSQNQIANKDDLKRAFDENHKMTKENFWLPLLENSNADYMVEYGEYKTKPTKTNKAVVEIVFKRIDGLETKLPFQMIYEKDSWHYGMSETASMD